MLSSEDCDLWVEVGQDGHSLFSSFIEFARYGTTFSQMSIVCNRIEPPFTHDLRPHGSRISAPHRRHESSSFGGENETPILK